MPNAICGRVFRLAQVYRAEWMEATLAIAGRCRFSLAELHYEYPREIVPPATRRPAGCGG